MNSGPVRLLRTAARITAFALVAMLAAGLAYVCVSALLLLWPTGRSTPPEAAQVQAYVISNGVHTDLVLPMKAAGVDWSETFLPSHAGRAQDGAEFVALGWGDLEFYLNTPNWSDLTLGRAIGAVLGRHPSALHVTWLQRSQLAREYTWRLPLTREQYLRLAEHVRRTLPNGQAQQIVGARYGDNDAFYAATGRYHLLRTCNEWTAQALRAAGAPVSRWAPFDFNVRWHLQPL